MVSVKELHTIKTIMTFLEQFRKKFYFGSTMNDWNTLPTDYYKSYRKFFYLFELSFNLFDDVNANKGKSGKITLSNIF